LNGAKLCIADKKRDSPDEFRVPYPDGLAELFRATSDEPPRFSEPFNARSEPDTGFFDIVE
jgi:hypothetical protein